MTLLIASGTSAATHSGGPGDAGGAGAGAPSQGTEHWAFPEAALGAGSCLEPTQHRLLAHDSRRHRSSGLEGGPDGPPGTRDAAAPALGFPATHSLWGTGWGVRHVSGLSQTPVSSRVVNGTEIPQAGLALLRLKPAPRAGGPAPHHTHSRTPQRRPMSTLHWSREHPPRVQRHGVSSHLQ